MRVFWFYGPFLVFVIFPVLDVLIGMDPTNPPDSVIKWLEQDRYFLKRLLHFVELERLDDRLDFFHHVSSPGSEMSGIVVGTEPWLAGPVPRPFAPENHNKFRVLRCDRTAFVEARNRPSPIN